MCWLFSTRPHGFRKQPGLSALGLCADRSVTSNSRGGILPRLSKWAELSITWREVSSEQRSAANLQVSAAYRRCLSFSHTGGDSRYGGKRRRQATAQAERQIHAINVCTRTLTTHVHSSSARAVPYRAKVSTREDKSSKWFHSASPPNETIVLWCFAAGVDAVMLRSEEEKANKRGRTVWS